MTVTNEVALALPGDCYEFSPECGRVVQENLPSQTQFLCVQCGYANHADVVGAMNILTRRMNWV